MREKTLIIVDKIVNFVRKYAWALAIASAVLAIAFTFLPVVNYEIREATYKIATGERTLKYDYVYGFNIISFRICN